jgi:predicted alpha/beta hydrolase family esterase
MKISEVDILILPGYQGSPKGHWQHGWAQKMPNARIVEQANWNKPELETWVENVLREIMMATRPVVLVGHSLGVTTIAHVAQRLSDTKVIGALLVAAPDLDQKKGIPKQIKGFAPVPMDPLPFPSSFIASSNDPFCSIEAAAEMAAAWGSAFNNAGELGHVNPASGFGAWPEGLMAFANLMKNLKAN